MNKVLLGLGALLLWKIFKLDEQIRSSEAAVMDILEDMDQTIAANIQETAAHMGTLYQESHWLAHQQDLLSLDYLNHLSEYKHLDAMTERPVTGEPYVLGAPSPTALEMSMKEEGLDFQTRRQKGL